MSLVTSAEKLKLAELYKIVLSDSSVYYWTDFEKGEQFIFDNHTYTPIPLMRSDLVRRTSTLSAGEKTITIPRHSDYITPSKLNDRYLDNATLTFYQVDRTDLTKYRIGFKGKTGNVDYDYHAVSITFVNIFNFSRRKLPKILYEDSCPYRIFDSDCKLIKSAWAATGSVDSGDANTINDSGRTEADDYYNFGYVEMTSGNNDGEERMVSSYTQGVINVFPDFTNVVSAGETYKIYPHCQRTRTLCNSIFSNATNYGGFRHIPRPEEALI